jgi:hypothetical protein
MKLDPSMHIGLHLVFFGKTGVTRTLVGELTYSHSRSSTGELPPVGREDEANGEKEIGERSGRCSRGRGGGASSSWIWEWGWRELSFIGNTRCKKGRSIDWRDLEHWTQKEIFKNSKHHLIIYKCHPSTCIWMLLTSSRGDSFFVFPFLANYLWIMWLTLTKWRSNSFLSTSNHAVILSLFSFPWWVISHFNQFSFTLYINISLYSFWVPEYFLLVMPSIVQSISLALRKQWKKETIVVIASDVWKKNEERKQPSWLTGAGLPYLIFMCFPFPC